MIEAVAVFLTLPALALVAYLCAKYTGAAKSQGWPRLAAGLALLQNGAILASLILFARWMLTHW